MERPIRCEVDDVTARLATLAVTLPALQEPVWQGYLERMRLTPSHPKTYAGYVMWAETIATLRDVLRPLGWTPSSQHNFELVVNEAKKLAIAVVTGNDGTGLRDRHPSNKCPKGVITSNAITANQLALFPGMRAERGGDHQFPTWVLLIHNDETEMRSELSLPFAISEEYITSWKERIILPALPYDDDILAVPTNDSPDIDIKIARRS
jgi:hypothetical protein